MGKSDLVPYRKNEDTSELGTLMKKERRYDMKKYLTLFFTVVFVLISNLAAATELHEAVQKENITRVKGLLEKGVNVDEKDDEGLTALHYASSMGLDEIVQFLLEKGANVNAEADNGYTALIGAIYALNFDLVKYLVEKGANINRKQDGRDTPLMSAAINGCPEIVTYLIEKGADVNSKGLNGVTALMHAAYRYTGTRATIKEKVGKKRITIGLRFDHLEVAKILIRKGANVNIKDNKEKTALDYAFYIRVEEARDEMITLLREAGSKK